MKKIALIQARTLSKRLRGKILMKIKGKTLLKYVHESISNANIFDKIILATTDEKLDDTLAFEAHELGLDVYRGSSTDVLGRFVSALEKYSEDDLVFRFTGDNPFLRYDALAELVKEVDKGHLDYVYIEGLSKVVPEIVKLSALRDAEKAAYDPFDREHVTPYLRKHYTEFNLKGLASDSFGLKPSLESKLTIDNQDDINRLEDLMTELGIEPKDWDVDKTHQWLRNKAHPFVPSGSEVELKVNLSGYEVGDNQPCFIVAEIGQNHNGDIRLAKELIEMSAKCNVNAVKFQKRDIPSELTQEAFNKAYDSPNSFGKTYGEHRIFLELDEEQHKELKEFANALGLLYFCTACDVPSVDLMERIGNPFYKVASRDLTNHLLLERLATVNKPVIISTGMATIQDIHDALEILKDNPGVIITQCTSQYPCPPENVNLLAMETMRKEFNVPIGFSDHTVGNVVSVAAVAMGSCFIEKHVTLNKAMKGSDQAGSLEEAELKELVDHIRIVEKAMGEREKAVIPDTEAAKIKLARSITSKKPISKGTVISVEHLTLKSPGDGLLWKEKDKVVGKTALVDIPADTQISLDLLK